MENEFIEPPYTLLAAGANVNYTDKNGDTPLYRAARDGHPAIVRLLLAAPGIDVNKATHGYTPLHVAVEYGSAECVKLLLAAPNIHVNSVDPLGKTPLFQAIENHHAPCAKLIRAAGGRK